MHQISINIVCSTVVIKGLYYIQSSHFITILLIATLLLRCIDYPCRWGNTAIGRSFPMQISPHPFHSNRKSVSGHWGILGILWGILEQNQKWPWDQNKGTWSCTGVPLSAAQIEAGCLEAITAFPWYSPRLWEYVLTWEWAPFSAILNSWMPFKYTVLPRQ